MQLTEACIRRPVLAWMLMLAVVGIGALAAMRIGVSQFPDLDRPVVTVDLSLLGAAPGVIERSVVQPLEERLAQIEGMRSISSVCRRGGAQLTITLDLGRNVDTAMTDVQNRISAALRWLPAGLEAPSVSKTNPEDTEIMMLSVSGPQPRTELTEHAQRIMDQLQTTPGIGSIEWRGVGGRNLRLWLDQGRLLAQDLTAGEVIAAIRRNHAEPPAGSYTGAGREIAVRVLGEAADVEAFAALIVAERGGVPVRVRDVGSVEDGFDDVRRFLRRDGEPAVGLAIRKQRGANAVALAAAIRAQIPEFQRTLPAGALIGVVFDNTEFVSGSLRAMWEELGLAVVLTALVCWVFLGSLRGAFNVLLAIPMSLLGTIAVLYACGFTLNTFTMLGLALAIGLVVDDAILVQESVQRRRELGDDRITAARRGTAEISFAALAATAAVLAVFSPVLFMSGEIGRSFFQFGLALCVAVALSYVEAMTLAPARLAQFGGGAPRESGAPSVGPQRSGVIAAAYERLERAYGAVLGVALRWPLLVLASMALICGLGGYALWQLPRELIPPQDSGRLTMRIAMAAGTDFDEVESALSGIEPRLRNRPDVERSLMVIGTFGENHAFVRIQLVPRAQRKPVADILQDLRGEFLRVPGVIQVTGSAEVPALIQTGGQSDLETIVSGDDWEALLVATTQAVRAMKQDARLVNVRSNANAGAMELRVSPDRARAADAGIAMSELADTLSALVGSARIGTFANAKNGRQQDIRVRLIAEQRDDADDLNRIMLRGDRGELIPLRALAVLEERPAVSQITRRDRARAITLGASPAPGVSTDVALAAMAEHLAKLPSGLRTSPGDGTRAQLDTVASLLFALGFGLIAAYMILAAQFNHLVHPFTVLSILPLAIAGAGSALWLSGSSLSAMSVIGILLLLGIVKKNSILLVDVASQVQREIPTLSAASAMRQAGPRRLRPILMTSVATLMAAVPIALGTGSGAELRAPMGIAVIGGVALSTLLSLLAVPALYVLLSRRRREPAP